MLVLLPARQYFAANAMFVMKNILLRSLMNMYRWNARHAIDQYCPQWCAKLSTGLLHPKTPQIHKRTNGLYQSEILLAFLFLSISPLKSIKQKIFCFFFKHFSRAFVGQWRIYVYRNSINFKQYSFVELWVYAQVVWYKLSIPFQWG